MDERFLLELDVPAYVPTGRGWVSWNADGYGQVAAADGTPTHDIWAEIDVTN